MTTYLRRSLAGGIRLALRLTPLLALLTLFAAPAHALALSGFSPAGGPGGTAVTLSGSGFTAVTTVKFNGIPSSFSVGNDTQITAYVPGSATTGPISVFDGISNATSTTNFFVGYC